MPFIDHKRFFFFLLDDHHYHKNYSLSRYRYDALEFILLITNPLVF